MLDSQSQSDFFQIVIISLRRFGNWCKVKAIVCIKTKLQRKKNWRPPTTTGVNGKEMTVIDGTVINMEKTPDDHPDGAMVIIAISSSHTD